MNKLLIYQIVIIFVLYIGYGFFYYTRKSISFMLPHINAHASNGSSGFNLTKNDIGIIISSQNLAYAISKFISGILSDFVSSRVLFGSTLLMSGLLNVGFRKDIDIYSVYTISFLLGLVQGPSWPCCSKLLQSWIPKSQFATWWSILSTSANVSGALGPLIATSIALRYHWTYGFMIPGCVCMSIGYIAIMFLRNRPSEVGLKNFPNAHNESAKLKKQANDNKMIDYKIKYLFRTNQNEQEGNEVNITEASESESECDDDDEEEEEKSFFGRIKLLFSYPFFISICCAYFLAQLVKTLISDWSQIYFIKIFKMNPYSASYFVSVFEFSGIAGSILSGILTDLIYHNKNAKKPSNNHDSIKIRMRLVRYYFFITILAWHLFNYHLSNDVSDYFLMFIASIFGFCCYGSIALLGVIATEFTSIDFSGTSHAIASLAANLGAITAGIPFGLLSKYYTWNCAFKIVQVFTILIAFVLVILRNTKPKFETFTSVSADTLVSNKEEKKRQ